MIESRYIVVDKERFEHGIEKLLSLSPQHPGCKYCCDMAKYFQKILDSGYCSHDTIADVYRGDWIVIDDLGGDLYKYD